MTTAPVLPAQQISKVGDEKQTHCPKHGSYVSVVTHVFASVGPQWSICPRCEDDLNAKAREYEERERREQAVADERKLQARVEAAGIPKRFRGNTFSDYVVENAAQRRVLEAVRGYFDNFANDKSGDGLSLLGTNGTGKTMLACIGVESLVRNNRRARYLTAMDLIRGIRDTWRGRESELTESQFIKQLLSLDLIVIDEVGVQLGSESERAQLTEIFDHLYRECVPMILIANLTKAQLKEKLGERVVDRLAETSRIIPCQWESWRQKQAATKTAVGTSPLQTKESQARCEA